jgi:hypothetical protein
MPLVYQYLFPAIWLSFLPIGGRFREMSKKPSADELVKEICAPPYTFRSLRFFKPVPGTASVDTSP